MTLSEVTVAGRGISCATDGFMRLPGVLLIERPQIFLSQPRE
jgi:hypothetical protein